jgi:hypothetical protein
VILKGFNLFVGLKMSFCWTKLHFVGLKTYFGWTKYPKCWTKFHFVGLKIHFVGLNCTILKDNPLKMSEFLRNKCFSNEKSPYYNLIPEKDDFLKEKCSSFSRML